MSKDGIAIDPARLADIKRYEPPTTGKDMFSKLGKLGFIRDHIRNYAELSAPFESLKMEKNINWTPQLKEKWKKVGQFEKQKGYLGFRPE